MLINYLLEVLAQVYGTALRTLMLVNPPDAPDHCPPAVAWLMSMKDGRVHQLRLFHAPAG